MCIRDRYQRRVHGIFELDNMDSSLSKVLTPVAVFGAKADLKPNVVFLDDENLIYVAGNNLVQMHMSNKTQKIIPTIEGSEGITAIAINKDRNLLAVANRSDHGVIIIYTINRIDKDRDKDKERERDIILKRKVTLTTADHTSKDFISLCFGNEIKTKSLISLGGPESYLLIYWSWVKDKGKIESFQTISGMNAIYSVSINPNGGNSDVVVIGNNTFRYYNLSNGLQTLRSEITAKENPGSTHYTAIAWDGGKFYITTNQGEILQLDNKSCKGILDCSPKDGLSIEHIIAVKKGLVTGGENNSLNFFSLESEGSSKTIVTRNPSRPITISSQLPEVGTSRIRSLTISPNEQWLIITLENNQIIKAELSFSNIDHIKFEYLHYNAHSAAINGLDVCVKKQLVATSSTDKSVRIWDYEHKSLEIFQYFTEEAHGIAFHPSGFHIIVGFTDKLRFMNIIEKKIVPYKEIALKSCKEIRFCHGGHMIAAASGSTIYVYNFYTGECPEGFVFKGQDTNITSIYWLSDDTGFFSANWNGIIEYWKLSLGVGEVMYSLKGTKINSVIERGKKEKWIYAVANDKQIKEVSGKGHKRMMDAGVVLGDLVFSRKKQYVIAGVEEKQKPSPLRVYNFPFTGDFYEIEVHSAEVRRLRVSIDGNYLFSAGADGCLFIFKLVEPKPEKPDSKKKKEDIRIVCSNEILFSRKELDNKYREKEKLDEENEEKRLENEEKQNDMKRIKENEKALQNENKNKEIEIGEEQLRKLKEEKEKTKQAYDENMEKLDKEHNQNKQEEEEHYQEKIREEESRIEELIKSIKIDCDEHKKEMDSLKAQFDEQKRTLEQEYYREQERLNTKKKTLTEEIKKSEEDYLKLRKQKEEEIWKQLDKEAILNYTEMHQVTKEEAIAQSHLDTSSGDKTKKEMEIHNLEHDKSTKENELKSKQKKNQELRKEGLNIDKDIEDRAETIKQKNQRVEELRKKKQELEKFKFVLDYKMHELKNEMEPKKQEIEKLNEQEVKMDEEVRHFTMANANMHLIVYDLLARQDGMTKELEEQKTKEQQDQQFKVQFSEDISDICKALSDPKALKNKVIEYHKKYLKEDHKKVGQAENQEAHANKRRYYEDKIRSLNSKKAGEETNHKNDNAKLMKENENLLVQYNDLCRDLHFRKLDKSRDGKVKEGMSTTKKTTGRLGTASEKNHELQIQNEEIERLTQEYEYLKAENLKLKEAKGIPQKLPPIEGLGQKAELFGAEPDGEFAPDQEEDEEKMGEELPPEDIQDIF
eukprot:TRINITY_DN3343_c0_g1_i1.p1 TRINITY_DN3343_c0_g1~~TRINITY_DN3343_c0_g1_i1.p1  ORF type:complete len:1270 (-),score=308.03 TRINITY_DN3343_c0_g1_i1:73-3882(-)